MCHFITIIINCHCHPEHIAPLPMPRFAHDADVCTEIVNKTYRCPLPNACVRCRCDGQRRKFICRYHFRTVFISHCSLREETIASNENKTCTLASAQCTWCGSRQLSVAMCDCRTPLSDGRSVQNMLSMAVQRRRYAARLSLDARAHSWNRSSLNGIFIIIICHYIV